MKKLNITKETFEKSKYFKNKYGNLEYVSESGKLFKTEKGKILMFKESHLMNEMDSGFEGGVPKRGGFGKYDPGPSYDDIPHKTKKPKKGTKKPSPLTVGELLDIIETEDIPDNAIVCGGSIFGVHVADELTAEFSMYDKKENRLELASLRAATKELGFKL